jgi:5-methyltetrahydrofolate--homocysteine methyltransferase
MITRAEFKQMLTERTLLLDGGYGTSFLEMGLGEVPPEALNIDHPKKVEGMHSAYTDAGADILITNTFGANRIKLRENSLEKKIEEINFSAVEIARRAAKSSRRRVLIFGDMSSTGNLPRPSGEGSWSECLKAFEEQAHLLLDAGVDGLIVETMTDIKELKAAVTAIRRISSKTPLIAHMAFDASGASLTGTPVEVYAAVMNDLDVDVLGMNCLLGPQDMIPNIRRLASATDRFLSAEPSAGTPFFNGKRTLYRADPLEFSLFAEELVEAGASIIGGCCGVTPDHIRAISAILKGVAPASRRARDFKPSAVLASRTAVIDAGEGFCVIGERISTTVGKRLRDSIKDGDWSVMTDFAAAQAIEGAHALDISFSAEPAENAEDAEKFFTADNISDDVVSLDRAASLPLSLDIQSADLMECAMTEYPGRALINSCTCDEGALSVKLPLLKKYGGVMILLAMDSKIQEDATERVSAVERALEYASGLGLGEDRFIIDPLVTPYGAGCGHKVTLDTIELCARRGLRTTIRLSNLSRGMPGMPNRSGINAAFLARAIELGLNSAILNTEDGVVMQTLSGALLLKGIGIGADEGQGEDPPDSPADALDDTLI